MLWKIEGIVARIGLWFGIGGLGLALVCMLGGAFFRMEATLNMLLAGMTGIGGVMAASGGLAWAAHRHGHFTSELAYGQARPALEVFSSLLSFALCLCMCRALVLFAPWDQPGPAIQAEPWLKSACVLAGVALLGLTWLCASIRHLIVAMRAPLALTTALLLVPLCLFLPELFEAVNDSAPEAFTGLVIAALLALTLLRVPAGLAAAFAGAAALSIIASSGMGLRLAPITSVTLLSYPVLAIFFAVLMGQLAIQSGIAFDVIRMVRTWLGRLPGGVYVAAAGAGSVYSVFSSDALPSSKSGEQELFRLAAESEGTVSTRKSRMFALFASTAAGRAFGLLLFPSAALFIAAMIGQVSMIMHSFGASSYSSALSMVLYIVLVLAALSSPNALGGRFATRRYDMLAKFLSLFPPKTMDFLVLGSLLYLILIGVATTAEAMALGVLLMLLHVAVYGRVNREMLCRALSNSVSVCGRIGLLLSGMSLLGRFLVMSRLPMQLAEGVTGLEMGHYTLLLLVLCGCGLIYALLGGFLRVLPTIMLTMPVFFPLFMTIGVEPHSAALIMLLLAGVGRSGSLLRELGQPLVAWGSSGDRAVSALVPGPLARVLFTAALMLLTVLILFLFMPSGFDHYL